MLKYDLAKLAVKSTTRKGSTALLPAIVAPLSAEAAYLKELRRVLKVLHEAVKTDLLPVVEADLKRANIIKDADESWFEQLINLARALVSSSNNMVNRILNLENERHTADFISKAKKTLGIDLGAIVRAGDNEQFMINVGLRNAGLIKGLSDDTIKRIQQAVMDTVIRGDTAKNLRARLVHEFEISDKRAKVIARDQISKFNADLNERRHVQAGITKYIWLTSADERVRPLHRSLNGETYEYGKPTGAEQGLPPGQPILCRCVAQAIVEF